MTDVEKLKAERERILKWREANADKLGTPEFTRTTRVLRLVSDLIARNGGNPTERAFVMRELTAIHAGERDGA